VSLCGLAIYIKTLSILRQKKNYGKSSNIFTMQKIIIFKKKIRKKNPLKERNQNPSRYYYNSVTKISQVSTQAKNIIFQKSSYQNK
jgi:hypothetical protein